MRYSQPRAGKRLGITRNTGAGLLGSTLPRYGVKLALSYGSQVCDLEVGGAAPLVPPGIANPQSRWCAEHLACEPGVM